MKGRNSNYRKGRQYEQEVKELFEGEGYSVCLATSSKGTYDMVATKTVLQDDGKAYVKATHVLVCMQQKYHKVRKSRAKPKEE